jgi:hypothetical protein
MIRKTSVPVKDFEKLHGRLRHACIGIPTGKGMMGPIDAAMQGDPRFVAIKKNPRLCTALADFGTLIKVMACRPTHCKELVIDSLG